MRHLVRTLLLAGILGMGNALAEDPPPPPANPGEAAPVMTHILSEGARVASPPAADGPSKAEQEQAALDSVNAAAANLRRIGIFGGESALALLIAGVIGGLIAVLIAVLRRRGDDYGPRR